MVSSRERSAHRIDIAQRRIERERAWPTYPVVHSPSAWCDEHARTASRGTEHIRTAIHGMQPPQDAATCLDVLPEMVWAG
jgi:hypothetical protein